MIRTERKEVVHKNYEYVPISGKCDVCGKELLPVDKSKLEPYYRDQNFYDYFYITTHHHDWGNDSCESYEYHDCCCLECALSFIKEYWHDCTRSKPFPTLELEMEHRHHLENHREI